MKIKNYKLENFNAKSVSPKGWIEEQLRTQLNGLSGNLHRFWPDIKDSQWIGGNAEGWERVPYWLDGYVPLVYLLNDKEGIEVANYYIENIISRQKENGWLAPVQTKEYDVWGIFIILKALLGYAQITNSEKVYHSIYRGLKALDEHIDQYPLFDWAKFRWFECLLPIYEIHKIYNEEWLINLANKLHDQGFDYYSFYKSDEYPLSKIEVGKWEQTTHIVNNCMAMKTYSLYNLFTKNAHDFKKTNYLLEKSMKYHGAVTGAMNGDECFSGLDPRQGSEICSIVEFMYSLEILEKITGKGEYVDHLEKLAFNALSSGCTADMWGHQYVNQVNAPFINRNDIHLWTTNGPETNIYGLEPHFGCCTANFNQGWPKFTLSAVMKKGKNIVINSYIPLAIKDENINIEIEGNYPFNNDITIKIAAKPQYLGKELNLRIPSWCNTFYVNGEKYTHIKGIDYINYFLKENNLINIKFDSEPVWVDRNNNHVTLVEGNLVYALKVEQEQVRVNEDLPYKELPHGDWIFNAKSYFAYRLVDKELKNDAVLDYFGSPFVKEKSYKSYFAKCERISFDIEGNYVNNHNEDGLNVFEEKEFIPIGINKCHVGEIYYKK